MTDEMVDEMNDAAERVVVALDVWFVTHLAVPPKIEDVARARASLRAAIAAALIEAKK